MRHLKICSLFTALLLCVAVTVTALAESAGPLNDLWNSGTRLLFHTDNVTLTGEATFLLDGKQFKKAQLNYIQDGASSFYDLVLLTPIAEGTEQKTGWTIIADEKGNLAVMEAYTPGIYRSGTCAVNNTLLRRSVQLDALTELGGFLVGQAGSLLPEGTVVSNEKEGGQSIHIALSKDQIPDMAVSALNIAAGYLSSRWFFLGYDTSIAEDEGIPFENYITVTDALTRGTVRWVLQGVDADFTLDAQGRLSTAKGEVRVASVFWDQTIREVTVRFDLSASDYGDSHVKPFDPSDYNVALPEVSTEENVEYELRTLNETERDKWLSRSKELLLAQGYTVSPEATCICQRNQNCIFISIENPGEEAYSCVFAEDGALIIMQNTACPWLSENEINTDAIDAGTVSAAVQMILSCVKEQNPAYAGKMGELKVLSAVEAENGSRYIMFDEPANGYFIVRVAPTMRIEYFSVGSNG